MSAACLAVVLSESVGNHAILMAAYYAPHEYLTAFCPIEIRVSTESGVQLNWSPISLVAAALGPISLDRYFPESLSSLSFILRAIQVFPGFGPTMDDTRLQTSRLLSFLTRQTLML